MQQYGLDSSFPQRYLWLIKVARFLLYTTIFIVIPAFL